jgi:hypothetical protein
MSTTAAPRYIFRDNTGTWRCASEIGLETGLRTITGEISALTFDVAITLAHHYRDQADAAEKLGYAIAEEDWSTWAELLEIWAARSVGAPGAIRSTTTSPITVRYHNRFDGDEPDFSEMVGHEPSAAAKQQRREAHGMYAHQRFPGGGR